MWKANDPDKLRFSNFEAALVRLGKNYCQKKCLACPVKEDCQNRYRGGDQNGEES
jgi:adenine-specific DNA glycosylase